MKSKIEAIRPYLKHKPSCNCVYYGYEANSGCTCGLEQALSALTPAQPQRAVGLTVEEFNAIKYHFTHPLYISIMTKLSDQLSQPVKQKAEGVCKTCLGGISPHTGPCKSCHGTGKGGK